MKIDSSKIANKRYGVSYRKANIFLVSVSKRSYKNEPMLDETHVYLVLKLEINDINELGWGGVKCTVGSNGSKAFNIEFFNLGTHLRDI